MRRNRRSRLLNLGIILIAYSTIYVYSAAVKETANRGDDFVPTQSDIDENNHSNNDNTSPNPLYASTEKTTEYDDGSASTAPTTISSNNENLKDAAPTRKTYRQKRNCTPPAIDQFPPPIMGPKIRERGGLIIHILIAIFTFLGLAIVCDDYFVSSLDRICEELRLSPDVAGATFMAAGSSAPELGTVIIGVFFAKDDIGVSGVIGSAVFNIMFVISVCALSSNTVCHLNWWPLVRDCFFYSVSIIVLLIIMLNDFIAWYEALVMLICYAIYCIVLKFNTPLEKWAYSLKLPIKLPSKEEQSALVTFKNVPDTNYSQSNQDIAAAKTGETPKALSPQEPPQNYQSQSYNDWDPNAAWGENQGGGNKPQPPPPAGYGQPNVTDSWEPNASWDQGQQNYAYSAATGDQGDQQPPPSQSDDNQQPTGNVGKAPAPDFYKSKDPKASQILVNPLVRPTEGGQIAIITWQICYPIHYLCQKTMPDCRTEKYRNWYGITFVMSMVWISFYSYLMVWMITIIGTTLGIPDTVMGLTFVAAGVSIPDALSSIAVIKEGYGDMAVSNAVGSNVFDIFVCLGLPWFIQTTILVPGGHVNVISKGLTYSTLSLLSTVVFLLLSVHLNGWKLDRRLGIILMIWYFLFIGLASMYELNVFGNFNPPQCISEY